MRRSIGRWRLWAIYAALIVLSQLFQLVDGRPGKPPSDTRFVELAPQGALGPVGGRPVRLAYDDRGSGPAVIYLHGSPGSRHDFDRLAPLLSGEYRTLALDLPGFGDSSPWVPDYSFAAHGRYVLELMDSLRIARAHLVGHSMGSGVAFTVASLAPERVASLTAYAGIGIQEGEGSGDYHFEHLKYAAGYGLLVVTPELIPHFGLLGSRSARHSFIRNFWDSDQRPLRETLAGLELPLLILHGWHDPLVPAWAAQEHHRIVRHSELVMLDDSHFMVFSQAGAARLAEQILPFLRRHDDPGAPAVRRTVDELGRPGGAVEGLPTGLELDRTVGPWSRVAVLAAATFASEDLTCISAGLLVRSGHLDFFVAIVGCLIGIFVTDLGLWAIGRILGRRALHWQWVARRVPPQRVERFGARFDLHLGKAVVASRFLPGTRVPMYIAAGAVGKRPVAFAVWLFVAALVWTPLLVLAAIVFGPAVARPFEALLGVGWLAWAAAAVVLFAALRVLLLASSWKGRARLTAAASRLWKPEFWPMWLYYLPVFPWIAFLALRHRGLTTPTAANPAMPHGGFVGESKYEILQRLPREHVVASLLVPESDADRLQTLRLRVEQTGFGLPLVLKPDEGQRGVGVRLARTWEDVERYLSSYRGAVLVQVYHAGPGEAGVFYYRHPHEEHGRIFSITDKRFPEVVGDGRSTIEELILRDHRLRMQAGTFVRRHADRLDEVLPEGERMRLAVSGNHCQGTMFLDGARFWTPELERAFDEVALGFDGFFFGRFDVRYSDVEAFRDGRDFGIVELNGVTSESTNIYDPSFGLLRAYRTLWRQWSIAFEIGAENRRRGHPVSTVVELWRASRDHYRKLPSDRLSD